MYVIVKAKGIYQGANVTAVWGPYRTKAGAWKDLVLRAKQFRDRRARRFQYETGEVMPTDMREIGHYELYLKVWKCYGDDERFPPNEEHWSYHILNMDESPAPVDPDECPDVPLEEPANPPGAPAETTDVGA